MMKKWVPLLSLVLLIGCAAGEANREKRQTPSAPPVITEAYAAREMRLGDVWKVYINASDPDGDMNYIVATIDQPGRGSGYPPAFIRMEKAQCRDLSGYIYLKTEPAHALEYTNINLSVQVKDKRGNMSNTVVFPMHFRMNAVQPPPPQGKFKEEELGPIMIRIRPLGDNDQNR